MMFPVPAYVILGATGKVGSLLARSLRKTGAELMLADNNEKELHKLAQELDVNAFLLDTTIPVEIEACMIAAKEIFGHINGLVCCLNSCAEYHHLGLEKSIRNISSSHRLTCAYGAVKAGIRAMCSGGGGSIVLLTDIEGEQIEAEQTKNFNRSLVNFARSISASYASTGIRVNVVSNNAEVTKPIENQAKNLKYLPIVNVFEKEVIPVEQRAINMTQQLLLDKNVASGPKLSTS